MKTLTAILLASGLAILNALSVSAQEQTPTIPQTGFPMPTIATCDTTEKMLSVIVDKYEEMPLISGEGSVIHQNGQMMTGTMTLWTNFKTSSFSVTLDNGNLMCLISMGNKLFPINNTPGTSL
jgi:hypothetical protein